MSKSLLAINILWALIDTIITALAICAFVWGARYFERWWLLLFAIIPLALFNQHSLVIDADLQAAKEGESNGRTEGN